jgi:acyl-coenzyme A thioesterase PaaI-like protein
MNNQHVQRSNQTIMSPTMEPVPQSTIDHFAAIPYAQPTLNDKSFKIISQSRTVTDDGAGHTLMGKTWNTDGTIKQLITLFRPSSSTTPLEFPQSEADRAEARRFYTLGGDLNAHPNLLHGGVIGCILDSSMGGAIGMALAKSGGGGPTFTVQLNITYKATVRTPGTIMVRSWVTKVEGGGRKTWAKGVIESEGGVVHAVAEGMWLRAKAKI